MAHGDILTMVGNPDIHMVKTYWGIMDRKQIMPHLLYDRGRDAIVTCNRMNHATDGTSHKLWKASKANPRFRVQRFECELKGETIDVYYHSYERKQSPKKCIFCETGATELDPLADISGNAEMWRQHQYHDQNTKKI